MEKDLIQLIRSSETEAEECLQAAQDQGRRAMEEARQAAQQRLEAAQKAAEDLRTRARAEAEAEAAKLLNEAVPPTVDTAAAVLDKAAAKLAERIVSELERC